MNNTVDDLIKYASNIIDSDKAYMLLSELLHTKKLDLVLIKDKVVDDEIKDKFINQVNLVSKNIPIQYVIGNVNFYGYTYKVNENVLIPRFETEELVKNTIDLIKENFTNPKVLDLCCGSGCIGLTIKNELECDMTLSDISKLALEVTTSNMIEHKLKCNIIESDLFTNINSKYDVIVSNPPYIAYDEEIEDIVKNNEPHLALFASNEGLYYYDKILSNCLNYLNDKFLIAFEIGYNQKDKIIKLINKYLENVQIISKKDMYNRDRMIFILKTE